jgi:hypothetical protein
MGNGKIKKVVRLQMLAQKTRNYGLALQRRAQFALLCGSSSGNANDVFENRALPSVGCPCARTDLSHANESTTRRDEKPQRNAKGAYL